MQIMFVCEGNTCRSPMCACVLRAGLKKAGLNVKVISRGIRAVDGSPINPKARKALLKKGFRAGNFKSKRLQRQDAEKSNIIITMNDAVKRLFGGNKTVSAKDITGFEIADPYGLEQTVYDETLTLIEKMCDEIIKELKK